MPTPAELKEAAINKMNAQLNGQRTQEPDMKAGTSVDSLIAEHDKKIDLSKLKLWVDAEEQGGKTAPDPNAPQLIDPDAPPPVDGPKLKGLKGKDAAKQDPAEEAPAKKPLKERAKEWERLATQQAAKFQADKKFQQEAETARAEATELKRQNDLALQQLGLAQKNPIEWLTKQGVTAVDLAKAAVAQKVTPAQMAQQALETRIQRIEEENRQLKQKELERENHAREEVRATAERTKFIADFASTAETKYPTLAKVYDEDTAQIVPEFIGFVQSLLSNPEMAAELKRGGRELYTDEVLMGLFEKKTAKLLRKVAGDATEDTADNKAASKSTEKPGVKKPAPKIPPKKPTKQLQFPPNFDLLPSSVQDRLIAEYASRTEIIKQTE